jgi:hypothetical protein
MGRGQEMAKEYTDSEARITDIQRGYGRSKTWITVEFYPDTDRILQTKKFMVDNIPSERLEVGSIIQLVRMRIGPKWVLDPNEHLTDEGL